MIEFYKILDPEQVPPQTGQGRPMGPMPIAMRAMGSGDVIAIPEKQRTYVGQIGKRLGMRFVTWCKDGVCYVRCEGEPK